MAESIRLKQVSLALLLSAVFAMSPAQSCETEYCINWYTFENGGLVQVDSIDGQWNLSGTFGQWEATEARALSGGPWRLTGGFWSLSLEALSEMLFQDRFEADEP